LASQQVGKIGGAYLAGSGGSLARYAGPQASFEDVLRSLAKSSLHAAIRAELAVHASCRHSVYAGAGVSLLATPRHSASWTSELRPPHYAFRHDVRAAWNPDHRNRTLCEGILLRGEIFAPPFA